VLFLTMLGLFLLASGVYNWRGGWSIGPRYLGAAPPFFAYAAVRAAENFAGDERGRRIVARALALGFLLASMLVTGSVALLINTLPEAISRPLPQFAVPMWIAGFTPHHLLELAGVDAAWPFHLLAGAAALSFFVVMLAAMRVSRGRRASLLVLAALFGGVAVTPAVIPPPWHDDREVAEAVALLSRRWEPRGRDRIARITAEIARGERDPCDRFELAHLQRSVGMIVEAERSMRVVESRRCEARE
jgi:hypothetical protein